MEFRGSFRVRARVGPPTNLPVFSNWGAVGPQGA